MNKATATNIVTVFVLVPVMMFLGPLILTYMWEWFVIPLLDAPALGYWNAMGLSMIISFFKYVPAIGELNQAARKGMTDGEKSAQSLDQATKYVTFMLFAWGISYLISFGI